MPVPMKPEDLPAICQLLIENVGTGPKEQPVLQYLFKKAIESLEANKKQENIGDYDLALEIWKDAGSTGSVRTLIGRLRKGLDEFYGAGEGRKENVRIRVGPPGYALIFERNQVPLIPGERIRELWSPYLESNRPVRVLYAAALFLQDRHQTDFHNPKVLHDDRTAISYLGINDDLQPTSGFIPSGIVQAIALLSKCFYDNDTPLAVGTLRSSIPSFHEDDEDAILIAAAPLSPALQLFEADLPIRSSANGQSYLYKEDDGTDCTSTCTDSATREGRYTHFALFSRKPHRYKGRVRTILTGTHDRAIEAAVSFMTRQKELKELISFFHPQDYFPEYFQVLFIVQVVIVAGESHFENIEIKKVGSKIY